MSGEVPGVVQVLLSSGFSLRVPRSPSGARAVVLAGLAGVGKTQLLLFLADHGAQVLDLEGLAAHRGSAFGGLGLSPQPPQSEFTRRVIQRVGEFDSGRVVFIEDEGPFIGSLSVPEAIGREIVGAPVLVLQAAHEQRVDRLLTTYGTDCAAYREPLSRMAARLGPRRHAEAQQHLARGDARAFIAALLPYFDRAYEYRMARSVRPVLATISPWAAGSVSR